MPVITHFLKSLVISEPDSASPVFFSTGREGGLFTLVWSYLALLAFAMSLHVVVPSPNTSSHLVGLGPAGICPPRLYLYDGFDQRAPGKGKKRRQNDHCSAGPSHIPPRCIQFSDGR